MYNRYASKSWFAVENNQKIKNGGRSWTPTGDLVDVKNNVKVSGTFTNTTNDIISSDVNGIVEPYNINLSPNETVTITAANTRNEANSNIITISQNGTTLASGSVQNQGDNVTATFTANTNTQISVNVTMSSANITNVWNSTGTAGAGPTQTISYTSIRVSSTIPRQVFKAPRTIYSGGGTTTSFYNQIKDDPTYNIRY